jgi:SEC-C motif
MAKAGRNDPCPCGSGKKYKRCCLEKDEATARALAAATPSPPKVVSLSRQIEGGHAVF